YGKGNYRAETDTFDTWFSSGQWPYATLMATGDMDRFYPTSVMETGRDILFLWVTRMIMMGLYRTGKVPFRNIYLHGMVNDEHGKKMSKSKGNVINPLEMTDKYGTDALRLALTIGITPGNDGTLSEKKIEGYRNFCNKLWNVARFILSQLPADYSPTPPEPKSLADRWILEKLHAAIKNVTSDLEKYKFSEAGQRVYSLLWDDFADWYIEANKVEPNLDLLVYGLQTILSLLHPIAPFVTEAVWQKMAWQKDNLIISEWPEAGKAYSKDAKDFERLQALIAEIRNLKSEVGAGELRLVHVKDQLIADNHGLVKKLAGVSEIESVGQGSGLALSSYDAWLDLEPQTIRAYLKRLQDKQQEQASYRDRLKKQLTNSGYIKSAPPVVVAETKDRLAQAEMLLSKLDEQIATIRSD
ncbi:MAG TPA: class I tRNA ligase family protein, partial [Candidatus Nanoarchaeia archaeon]|nr:class I tRNA ligase family protein [Candidatus Nanoarchaeia archaeon]